DVAEGQKTGFFLDQRENRQRVRALAAGRDVLDGFCYTGGFAIAALAGGAKRVTALENSQPALDVAKENLEANPLDASLMQFVKADVFGHLRKMRDENRHFDLILLAFKLLAPGGLLATFSCSGGVNAELFQSVVAGAALDAGANAKIIERFAAAADHPVALEFPEGDYLKGLLVMRSA